jgi:hypothetical protein
MISLVRLIVQEPAYNVVAKSRIGIISYPLPKDFHFEEGTFSSAPNTIPQGQSQNLIACGAVLEPNELAIIHEGTNFRLALWGQVYYEDVFGVNDNMIYCHQYGRNLPPTDVMVTTNSNIYFPGK